jgi:hypothetical protein
MLERRPHITDAGLTSLAALRNLQALQLSGSGITDERLRSLAP